ncbi:hypothetical protein BIW11_00822 [Tropilaelaps mercedesae]|uniref:C2H2-type domain-containing protein n=1 Tax=Tropilaelaps mercedesae TaxID=418985 RepID=A0A1V9XP16_9ACAR|nr:hypothetical protein BIW11_00822 [Tropilaelaps mercedesae]
MTATVERSQATRTGPPGSPSESHESDDDDMRLTITTDLEGGPVNTEEAEANVTASSSITSTSSASTHRCYVCGEAAASAHGLSLHLRRVHDVISCTSSQLNPAQHTCKLCGKSLSSASSLDRHMLVHSGERPFKCKICGMAFTTNGNMHRHMRTHSGAPLIGPLIGKLHHGQLLQVHPSAHGSPAPINQLSPAQSALQDFRCLICGRLFLSKTALEKHVHGVHDDAPVSCPKCFTRCASYSGLINGLHTCIEQTAATRSSTFEDLTHIDFSCSHFSLIAAVECERWPRRCPTAVGCHDCDRCARSFPSKDSLAIHRQRHDERQTFCVACRTSYMSSIDLQRHQAERHRELVDDKAHLMAALQLYATNTAPRHDLSDVQTLLSLANTIPVAKTSVGEPTSENSCDSLADSAILGVTTAGDTEESTCTMCGLAFKNVQLLKRHFQLHVNAPFACTLCPYISTDKSTLVRHLRTHNGERPFQCAICKYAFTTKANCERHVRKRHNKQTKAEIRSAMQYNPHMQSQRLSPTFSAHRDSGSTVCKYCNKDFKFNRVLRHHLRSLNNSCSRKPFCCIVCKLGFSTKNNCIRHVLKQHPEFQHKLSEAVSSKPLPVDEASGQDPPVPLTFDNDNDQGGNQDGDMEDMETDQSSDHIVPRIDPHELQPVIAKAEVLKPTAVVLSPVSRVVGTLHKVTVAPVAIDVVKSATPLMLTTLKATGVEVKKAATSPVSKVTIIPAAHQKTKEQHPGKIEPPVPPQDEPLDLAVHALDLSRKDAQRAKPMAYTPTNNFIDALLTAAKYVPETPTMLQTNDVASSKFSNELTKKNASVSLTKTFILSDKTRTALKILVNAKKSDERSFDEQEQHDLASVSALLNAANSHLMLQHMIGENEKDVTDRASRPDPVMSKKGSSEIVERSNEGRKHSPNSVACKFCRRKFPWTSSLRRHLLTHTGQKPFKCPHCPIWFTTKSNCERHLLRKHDKLAKASRARGTLQLATRASTSGNAAVGPPTRRMRLRCPCCARSFRNDALLAEHLRQPDRPFRCVLCCELFREPHDCVQHVRRAHDLRVLHQTPAEPAEANGSPRCFVCLQPVEAAALQTHFRAAHGADSDANNNSSSSSNGGSAYRHGVIRDVDERTATTQQTIKPVA